MSFISVIPSPKLRLASGESYPASGRALVPSAVILVPKTEFVALLRKRPELALRMIGR